MESSEEESDIDVSPCVSVTSSLDLLSDFIVVDLPGVFKVYGCSGVLMWWFVLFWGKKELGNSELPLLLHAFH